MSRTCSTPAGTRSCTCSARAPSQRRSRFRFRCCARSGGHRRPADRAGPVRQSATGQSLTRGAASRLLQRVVREAGVHHDVSPHTLRRTFCTAGLISGVPLRDMQYAMRHAGARTTIRYDMARANLDRHAAHSVAAYLAGMAID